jgi:flagellar motor switch protein FliM
MADKFLTQEEEDALLQGVAAEADQETPVPLISGARDYNLATQERIVRGRMHTLEIINERFARLLRIDLFNFLRRGVEVSVGPVRLTKYSDFIQSLAVPTNLNLVHMNPLRGIALLVLDPTLIFLVVDNLFGGDGRYNNKTEGRDFTQTEQRIIQRILDIIFEVYSKSWQPVYPIEFEFIRSEMYTRFANIATHNEVVVVTTFNVELGSTSSEINLCFPYSMIEPIRDLLTSPLQGEVMGADQRWVKLMTQQVQAAEIEIVADLTKTNMRLGDVLNMKVGDVIPLNIEESIEANVDGIPIMKCKYGLFNGQYALRVDKLLRSNSTEYIKGEPYGE